MEDKLYQNAIYLCQYATYLCYQLTHIYCAYDIMLTFENAR